MMQESMCMGCGLHVRVEVSIHIAVGIMALCEVCSDHSEWANVLGSFLVF